MVIKFQFWNTEMEIFAGHEHACRKQKTHHRMFVQSGIPTFHRIPSKGERERERGSLWQTKAATKRCGCGGEGAGEREREGVFIL